MDNIFEEAYSDEKFTVLEFKEYVDANPLSFITYCEIIIDKGGFIHLSVPSHIEAMVHDICLTHNMTRDDVKSIIGEQDSPMHKLVDTFGYCVIWYYSMLVPKTGVTPEQLNTIKYLYKWNIISKDNKTIDYHFDMRFLHIETNSYDRLVLSDKILLNELLTILRNDSTSKTVMIMNPLVHEEEITDVCQIVDDSNPTYRLLKPQYPNHDIIIEMMNVNHFDDLIYELMVNLNAWYCMKNSTIYVNMVRFHDSAIGSHNEKLSAIKYTEFKL